LCCKQNEHSHNDRPCARTGNIRAESRTGRVCGKVVVITLTPTVREHLTTARRRIEEPTIDVRETGARLLRLIAHRFCNSTLGIGKTPPEAQFLPTAVAHTLISTIVMVLSDGLWWGGGGSQSRQTRSITL
jgi:hypothetical protein